MSTVQSGLTPKELAKLTQEFEISTGYVYEVRLRPKVRRNDTPGWVIQVVASTLDHSRKGLVDYSVMIEWPTSSHSTMLGAMLALMYQVEAEIDASKALDKLGE